LNDRLTAELTRIQNELFDVGSDLCFIEADKQLYTLPQIEQRHIDKLETLIDELSAAVGPLENFILPGGSLGSAQLHMARTICRRAEREVTALLREEAIGAHVLTYLNRLSDALFVMARYENYVRSVPEPLWKPGL
jgi:cob(I)alamin adenosyltransferase